MSITILDLVEAKVLSPIRSLQVNGSATRIVEGSFVCCHCSLVLQGTGVRLLFPVCEEEASQESGAKRRLSREHDAICYFAKRRGKEAHDSSPIA
jgi:hypothetical protein